MPYLSDIQLIERNSNIETFSANLRIIIKKVYTNNITEALLYKLTLLEYKKRRKIYDVIEENNILYIYLDPSENINDLLFNKIKIEKELVVEGHCAPITKNELNELIKKEESLCKIKLNKIINNELTNCKATGFFLELNLENLPFNKCLITNNHVLDNEYFKINNEIKFDYKGKEEIIQINNRIKFTNQDLDYTCIEIFDSDNITQFFHINPQLLTNNLNIFLNKDIFILQYPKGGDFSFSDGRIISIDNNSNIIHNCSTLQGSSGSPIILRYDMSIIGLHYGAFNADKSKNNISFNLSTSIISIVNDLIKISHVKGFKPKSINIENKEIKGTNFIIANFNIVENDVYKNINIINSYEQIKRNNPSMEFNKNLENEKGLTESCQIEINNKTLPFSQFYEFNELNLAIKFIFKKNINIWKFLFFQIQNLLSIDLSNFNGTNITIMSNMFQNCYKLQSVNLSNFFAPNLIDMSNMFSGCSSLTNVNLSNFNSQNLTDMSKIFFNCKALTSIDLSNFNAQNVTNMSYMFTYCESLANIDLSTFKTQKVIDMSYMFSVCKSLTNIDLSNFNTQNATNMSFMFYNCQSVKNINLSSFNTEKVTNMSDMFSLCKSLETLNINNFKLNEEVNTENIFLFCESLKDVILKDEKLMKKVPSSCVIY